VRRSLADGYLQQALESAAASVVARYAGGSARGTVRRADPRSDLGSGGEIGHQLYDEFGAGKLDGVDFEGVPADETQDGG
jgi:hypothetical protein